VLPVGSGPDSGASAPQPADTATQTLQKRCAASEKRAPWTRNTVPKLTGAATRAPHWSGSFSTMRIAFKIGLLCIILALHLVSHAGVIPRQSLFRRVSRYRHYGCNQKLTSVRIAAVSSRGLAQTGEQTAQIGLA
jgi:hypothetical protein